MVSQNIEHSFESLYLALKETEEFVVVDVSYIAKECEIRTLMLDSERNSTLIAWLAPLGAGLT